MTVCQMTLGRGGIMSRFIMSALLCTFAFAQTAHAVAPVSVAKRNSRELAALKSKDPNDENTPEGIKYKLEKKQECSLASHKGDRNADTHPADEQVASASNGKASGYNTAQ